MDICIVCKDAPAACFFNNVSAGHSEPSVRALIMTQLEGGGTVGDVLQTKHCEYMAVNFAGVPEGKKVLCDRCRSSLRHRAKQAMGFTKTRRRAVDAVANAVVVEPAACGIAAMLRRLFPTWVDTSVGEELSLAKHCGFFDVAPFF
jgi:hypothetical protein